MEDWFADKQPWEAQSPPTTEWMDGIRTEEDYLNRYKMVVLCGGCMNWFHFERDPSTMLALNGQVCDCGSTDLIGSTIISERSWRPDMKKKIPKQKKR